MQSVLSNYDLIKQNKILLEKIKISKENQETSLSNKNGDILIIIHKIELRTLLLGKNGFYNNIISNYSDKFRKKVCFILIYSSNRDLNIRDNIMKLAEKGQQEDLAYFIKNDLIFYYNQDINILEDQANFNDFIANSIFKDISTNKYYNIMIEQHRQNDNIENYKDLIEKSVFPEKVKSFKCYIL